MVPRRISLVLSLTDERERERERIGDLLSSRFTLKEREKVGPTHALINGDFIDLF